MRVIRRPIPAEIAGSRERGIAWSIISLMEMATKEQLSAGYYSYYDRSDIINTMSENILESDAN